MISEKKINKIVENLKKYGDVVAIILFGSYVSNKVKPISDVDIAVIVKNESMEHEIGSYSSNIFDIVPFHRLPLYIQFELLKHGKILFLRDENYFKEVKSRTLREYMEMKPLYERMSRRILA